MSHPQHHIRDHVQHRIPDYLETTTQAASVTAARYSDTVNYAGMGALIGIETGDWSSYADAFKRLQDAAWEALDRRRSADFAANLFGGRR